MTYALDARNRLLIKTRKSVLYPRGRFSVDQRNRLVYWLNETPAWRKEYRLPSKIVWQGRWQLKPDGVLELAVDEPDQRVRKQVLGLRCRLVSAENNKLVFSLKSEESAARRCFSLLQFQGSWGCDEANRLQFYLSRRSDSSLVFHAGWTLNSNQQLLVRMESVERVRGRRIVSEAEVSGFWQVCSRTRVRYIFCAGSSQTIDFRVQLESATLRPVRGAIKFRLGTGMRASTRAGRTLVLFGDWKFSRGIGLEFDIVYGRKSRRSGLSLAFSRELSRRFGGQAFLRLSKREADARIEAGVTIPF